MEPQGTTEHSTRTRFIRRASRTRSRFNGSISILSFVERFTPTRDPFCVTQEATTANHVGVFSLGLLWRGSCMVFLRRTLLYRAGTERHGNAKTKRCFAALAQTLNAYCFVRFDSFAAFKPYSTPRVVSTAAVSGRTGEMCG